MSEERKCSACGKKKAVSEMKTCMHNQMHRYVCDTKCMNDFYNPPKKVIAHPAETEGVELVPFWVLFDATTPEPLIKKRMPEGVLAFFDNEEDARRAKALHPGTDYKRAPYVRAAALSAVTAERDRLRALSVENILLDVVPGDGEGHEVHATSVEEVEAALTAEADRAEAAEAERDQLRAEVEALQSQERYREQDLEMVIEQRDHYANRVLHLETSALRIADDYQPSSDAESVLAPDEMRAALVGLVGAAKAAKEA